MKFINNGIMVLLALSLFSCREDELVQEQEVPADSTATSASLKQKVYEVMHEWYLWNEELPELDTSTFATASELMEAMKKSPTDKWSYIEKEETYDNYFENGQYEGYGFSMRFDASEQLRVAYVYQDSPFFRAGVGRSWIISKINGQSVQRLIDAGTFDEALSQSTNTFDFLDADGRPVSKSITKSTIGINSVLFRDVYQVGGIKAGYLVFNNFLQTSLAELQDAFGYFQEEGISELVLDLRYNGGGRVSMAQYIASNVLGSRSAGQDFIRFVYNKDKSSENQTVAFSAAEHNLNLNRLIVITSKGTASASELVINSLRPFMEVVLIGDDTYGKPVGSFPIKHEGYAINPISFKTLNHAGEGEYFDGLQANAYVADDLAHDFGDINESRLKEALHYILNGSFSGEIARIRPSTKTRTVPMSGFRQEIGAY